MLRSVCLLASALSALLLSPTSQAAPRNLSLEDRVAAQRAVEEVYWRHRIWPAENPDPKPPLSAMLSNEELRARVVDALRMAQAARVFDGRSIGRDDRQRGRTMRSTFVLVGLLAAGLPGAAEEPQATLRGVPVQTVWQTANGVSATWLSQQPQFTPSGRTFVATSTLDAKKPETGQPIGLEIVWTVAEVADAPAGLSSFAVPADTTMVVVGRYTYGPTGRTVETYAAIKQKADGSLVSEDLGARLPDGSVAPSTGNLASQAFRALGIRGPYTTIITLPPGGGD